MVAKIPVRRVRVEKLIDFQNVDSPNKKPFKLSQK